MSSAKYIAVGAYVIAEKIKPLEQTSSAGILLAGKASSLARAKILSRDFPTEEINDRVSEALWCLDGEEGSTILYIEQHAIPIEDDIIAVPAEYIVALVR